MSEPPQYGDEWHGQQRPPYPYQQGQYSAGYPDPTAPYGRHPITGEPLSDKSKVIAGLLQLIGLFGLLGFGRMYIGQVGFGVAQLLIGLVVGLVTCGYGFAIPAIWGVVDAVLIFTGNARDSYGRPLRDGT